MAQGFLQLCIQQPVPLLQQQRFQHQQRIIGRPARTFRLQARRKRLLEPVPLRIQIAGPASRYDPPWWTPAFPQGSTDLDPPYSALQSTTSKSQKANYATIPWRGRVGSHGAKRNARRGGVTVSQIGYCPKRETVTPPRCSFHSRRPTSELCSSRTLQGRVRERVLCSRAYLGLSAAVFLHSERNFLRSLPCRPLASASFEHSRDAAVCGSRPSFRPQPALLSWFRSWWRPWPEPPFAQKLCPSATGMQGQSRSQGKKSSSWSTSI